jgi:hypothetical protein
MVQADLGIKTRPYSKNAKAKGAVRAAQVVKHLPSKLKALSSDPSTKKKKKKIYAGHSEIHLLSSMQETEAGEA